MVSNSKKLLVADDSLTIQKVIRLALANEGYDIQAVSDGKDAIQQISLFRPDVILIDVSMPNLSAFEIKREMNSHSDFSHMRAILMSSAFERVDEDQAKDLVFHGRLIKPFDPAHLRKTLTEVLLSAPPATENRPQPISAAPLPPPPPPPPPEMPDEFSHPSVRLGDTELPPLEAAQLEPIAEDAPIETGFSLSIEPPPPSIPIETYGDSAESDIKNLTASTIKMSGLGDMDWSVQENATKDPTDVLHNPKSAAIAHARLPGIEPNFPRNPPPPPEDATQSLDLNALNESLGVPGLDVPEWTSSPPTEEPTNPALELPKDFLSETNDVPDTMPLSGATAAALAASEPIGFSDDEYRLSEPRQTHQAATPAFDPAMVETIVRNQLEEILRGLTSKSLPEIAERVIKEEIHKLLSQSP